MVLLVMVDDKKAEDQQSGDNAANNPGHERKDGKRRGERQEQKERSGNNAPPTPHGGIMGEGFRGGNKFRASSQLQLCFIMMPDTNLVVDRSFVTFLPLAEESATSDTTLKEPARLLPFGGDRLQAVL